MFRALVDLGRDLEQKGKLPPPGFYNYGQDKPIRWLIHLSSERIYMEQADLHIARPFSGRTNSIEAHLLADEAGYALGVAKRRGGELDPHIVKKHQRFLDLLDDFLAWYVPEDDGLRSAVILLSRALRVGGITLDERHDEIANEDWVSFLMAQDVLQGTHLFEQPGAKAFWLREMERRCASNEGAKDGQPVVGACAACGRDEQKLVRKLPLKAKLATTVPLTSLNRGAFTSFIGYGDTDKKANLGICFECGDTATRAFNYLRDSSQHHRVLVRDPRPKSHDKLTNQHALLWLKAPAPVRVEAVVLDLTDLDWGAIVDVTPSSPRPELSQLMAVLKQPWIPTDSALRLDDYGFHLAVLSPNIGRIALREWLTVSIASTKSHLLDYLEALRVVMLDGGGVKPVTIKVIGEAFKNPSPDLTSTLLRCAYAGHRIPLPLAIQAGQRLNRLFAHENSLRARQASRGRSEARVWDDRWPHALAAVVKLVLFYGAKEVETMIGVNPLYRSRAYHCGRLLAVLEVAQQWHYFRRSGKELKATMVSRSYGGAASSPAHVLGPLWRVSSTAHLPEAGDRIRREVEAVSSTLVELGGMPDRLLPAEQAEFGLGFYHQRARNRELFTKTKEEAKVEGEAAGDAVLDAN